MSLEALARAPTRLTINQIERCLSALVLEIGIGTVFQRNPHLRSSPCNSRQHERRHPPRALLIDIGILVEKNGYEMPPSCTAPLARERRLRRRERQSASSTAQRKSL